MKHSKIDEVILILALGKKNLINKNKKPKNEEPIIISGKAVNKIIIKIHGHWVPTLLSNFPTFF